MFGNAVHDQKIKQLHKRFNFEKLQKIDEEGVGFNGRRLRKEKKTAFSSTCRRLSRRE
jgi:hypothetical protein